MIILLITLFFVQVNIKVDAKDTYGFPWYYKCEGGLCKKQEITEDVISPFSLEVCELFCGASSSLWPKPTGHLSLSKRMVQLDPEKISIADLESLKEIGDLLGKNLALLKHNAQKSGRKLVAESGGLGMLVRFTGILETSNVKLTLNTDESYTLTITEVEKTMLNATITAKSYFGARHGLETLSQLIVFDDLRDQIQIPSQVSISDGPVYPYRGLLLDTSRNFIEKSIILRTIDGMAMSKMNTLHWHIIDSHSFPYVGRTWLNFSKFGSYTPEKIYNERDVEEIVEHGLIRGVRVLPEFDAPAHVGEGWQWVDDDAVVCFKAEPWRNYCVEPPCGQLNPTNEKVYEILEGIYKDMIEDFQPDIFHMGGDEVNINCWNSSSAITNWMQTIKNWELSESNFYKLWDYFQRNALNKLILANGGKEIPVILWTSGLTNAENIKYLDPKKYIVQIWTSKDDPTIGRLLRNNFKVIFSNYDALYLDCGFSAWIGEGNNWCAPYKGWQNVYDNSPLKIVASHHLETKRNLILGGEAALWTEQADGMTIDSKIWPRAAALAERLWAEPTSSWIHAEQRMLRHRERFVRRGIAAESLQPEWCLQNQGQCYA
ncbi:chitooligosaccharidolytic beta-N-acetylglucosaminidase isoform X1 [Hylaeus volcanicus]|uniref:chitooligosaccharidolytic beta-N-acetylglucosaminidase isoform X1 n=2 Tax=Hylaeus volcanicus TaxID=313075 RepID=UPI0023B7DF55|nr:chitooligosaccharidolytic beta-N-acetylglucosaminidase isoform X1 [Hylaeus volcanicus]